MSKLRDDCCLPRLQDGAKAVGYIVIESQYGYASSFESILTGLPASLHLGAEIASSSSWPGEAHGK